jgi:hypothetical protein
LVIISQFPCVLKKTFQNAKLYRRSVQT